MTRSIRSLAAKELSQHFGLLLWVLAFTIVTAFLLIMMLNISGGGLSYLSATSVFANPALIVIAFFLGQRMITAEYYGQTQQFIESLPVRRREVHWVKYCVGFAFLMLSFTVAWLGFVYMASSSEPITGRFAALMLLRMLGFAFALWSLVYTFSLLGRLRIPLIAIAAFVALMVFSFTSFEINRFGPLALMDQDLFAFARSTAPVQHLIETIILGSAILVLGLWMASARDGSLTETLATPVTSRAKGFLFALAVTALGIVAYLGPEPEAEPFEFTGPQILSDGNVEIDYLYPELEQDALKLLQYVLERSTALNDIAPPTDEGNRVRISFAPSEVATTFRTYMSDPVEGVVVGANFQNTAEWDEIFFGAYIFHHVVAARKEYRLYLESYHWMLDGFTRWWSAYGDLTYAAPDSWFDPVMLEALHTARDADLTVALLRDWETTSEIYGESGAMNLAYSAFRVLQAEIGTAAVLDFMRAEFARPTYNDLRDWWIDWRDPLPDRFYRATGMTIETFVDTWGEAVVELSAAPVYKAALDAVPKSDLRIETDVNEKGYRSLNYTLTLDRPLPAGSKCTALHAPLEHYDMQVGRTMLREVDLSWPGVTNDDNATTLFYSLQGLYGQGTRLFAAMECKFPQFPAPFYLGSERLTMP